MITKEREYELIVKAQKGDVSARDALLEAHKNFIWLQAIRQQPMVNGHETGDIANEIWVAMTEAIRKFDVSHGVRFLTYAGWYVTKAINKCQEINGAVRYPRATTKKAAERRGFNVNRPVLSLDAADMADRLSETPIHTLSSTPYPVNDLEQADDIAKLQKCLDCLSERKRYILLQRAAGLVFGDIGSVLGITRERVRQIELSAMAELRSLFNQTGMQSVKIRNECKMTERPSPVELLQQLQSLSVNEIDDEIQKLEVRIADLRRLRKLVAPAQKTFRRKRPEGAISVDECFSQKGSMTFHQLLAACRTSPAQLKSELVRLGAIKNGKIWSLP